MSALFLSLLFKYLYFNSFTNWAASIQLSLDDIIIDEDQYYLHLTSPLLTFKQKPKCWINISIYAPNPDTKYFTTFDIDSFYFDSSLDFNLLPVIKSNKITYHPQCYRKKNAQMSQISSNKSVYYNYIITNYYQHYKSTFRVYNNDKHNYFECEYNTSFPINQALNIHIKSNNITYIKQTQFIIHHSCKTKKEEEELHRRLITNDCESQHKIKHLKWLNESSLELPLPYNKCIITADPSSLSLDIIVNLAYLGRSTLKNNFKIQLGTTYSLDFSKFNRIKDRIDQPGTCSNRLYESYIGSRWKDYWDFSRTPNIESNIGEMEKYLSYPMPSDYWTLSMWHLNKCGPIQYKANFEWNDILNCRQFNNKHCDDIHMIITKKWINLTGIFHVDIVSSPLNNNDNNNMYYTYPLISMPFIIPIAKSVDLSSDVKSNTNLFTITIAAVYKYKEKDINGYKLILLTESADWIMLNQPYLLSYPINTISSDNIEYISSPISGPNCINGDAHICSQLWEIYIDDIDCPSVDLSGIYGFQYISICNPLINNNNELKYCNKYNNNKITVSSHLSWIDDICEPRIWIIQFDGSLLFYKDITFTLDNQQDNIIYSAGVDTVFVELIIKIPLNNYIISSIKLTNVWICSTDEDQYGTLSISQLRAIGGCLSPNIDNNGPYHIIQNYDEKFYFNSKHINLDDENNDKQQAHIVRFSFIPPKSVSRDKLFIHSQVTLTLIDDTLHNGLKQNQIRHFGGYINVNAQKDNLLNNANLLSYMHMDKVIIVILVSVVLCVICMNLFIVQNKDYKSNRKRRKKKWYRSRKRNKNRNRNNSECDTDDTETTAFTIGDSAASRGSIYAKIAGITSNDDAIIPSNSKNKIKNQKNHKNGCGIQKNIQKKNNNLNPKNMNIINIDNGDNGDNVDDDNDNNNNNNNSTSVNYDDTGNDATENEIAQIDLHTATDTDGTIMGPKHRWQPLHRKKFQSDTDLTTDIATVDELTSCTDCDDNDNKENKPNDENINKIINAIKIDQSKQISKPILTTITKSKAISKPIKVIKAQQQTQIKPKQIKTKTKTKSKSKLKSKPKSKKDKIVENNNKKNQKLVNINNDNNNNDNDCDPDINADDIDKIQYLYQSETEQEKRQRVQLIKQIIDDDTEMDNDFTEYTDDYEDD